MVETRFAFWILNVKIQLKIFFFITYFNRNSYIMPLQVNNFIFFPIVGQKVSGNNLQSIALKHSGSLGNIQGEYNVTEAVLGTLL